MANRGMAMVISNARLVNLYTQPERGNRGIRKYPHYSDVIMGVTAYQITSLTIVYSTVCSGEIKENIKAPRHWPLYGVFTGDRWIPRTNGQ